MDKRKSSPTPSKAETTRDRERPNPEEPRESPWWRVGASVAGAAVATVLRWVLEHAFKHGRA